MTELRVWRFDDSVVVSHVIAGDQEKATAIFDRVMGQEYRDESDDDAVVEIYEIPGTVELPIDLDGTSEFVTKTADGWIEHHGEPCFL